MKQIVLLMAAILATGSMALKAADLENQAKASESALTDLQGALNDLTKGPGDHGAPGGHFNPGGNDHGGPGNHGGNDHGFPGNDHGGPGGNHGGFNPPPPPPPSPVHPPQPGPWHPQPGPQPGPWHPQPGPQPGPWHPQPFPPQPFPPQPYPPQPFPPQPYPVYGATVYQHANFGGYSVTLPPGEYSLAALQRLGVRNDDLSSVQVPYGFRVVFFEDDNFMGRSWTVTGDNYNFANTGYNDVVTSIIVYGRGQY